jgi:hypothetical protein
LFHNGVIEKRASRWARKVDVVKHQSKIAIFGDWLTAVFGGFHIGNAFAASEVWLVKMLSLFQSPREHFDKLLGLFSRTSTFGHLERSFNFVRNVSQRDRVSLSTILVGKLTWRPSTAADD